MIVPKSISPFRQIRCILELRKRQYQKPRDLKRVQNKRIRKMVRHAYYNVPFYHSLFKKVDVKPSDINCVADLTKLPTVSKADFLQNWESFISHTAQPKKCEIARTSGTTGTPLKILEDQVTKDIGYALKYYAFFECGMKLKDRLLELTAAFPSLSKCVFRHGPIGFMKVGSMKGFYLSVFNDPAENVDEIFKINPDVIYSYPTALECIIEDFGSRLSEIKPKLVFTQAETVTERRRKLIEDCWGISPCDTYGSREFFRIAFECNEHQGLHVINDWVIVELMKDGEIVGANEQGEVIVTSLYNYTMPLIRYKLGDLAVWSGEKCTCGRGWPLLKAIEGRIEEIITLPSGRKVSSLPIGCVLFKTIVDIKHFQIIQKSRENFIIRVVCNKNVNKKGKERVQRHITQSFKFACFNENLDIQVKFVPIILPQPSGKTPDFIREM